MRVLFLILVVLFLFCWAVAHGGTKDPQPIPPVYDDDHDVCGLLEED